MNPFVTDHPMMTEPSARSRRVQRRLFLALTGYFAYLLLLGPIFALDGNGFFKLPESAVSALGVLAAPVVRTPVLRAAFACYLDWWYHNPNDPCSGPDWR